MNMIDIDLAKRVKATKLFHIGENIRVLKNVIFSLLFLLSGSGGASHISGWGAAAVMGKRQFFAVKRVI